MRGYQDSVGCVRDSNESRQLQCLLKSSSVCDRKGHKLRQEDESSTFEAEVPKAIELSLETQSDSVKKVGWFSWKRRRLSLRPIRPSKDEPLIKRTRSFDVHSRLNQQVHLQIHTNDSVLYYVTFV